LYETPDQLAAAIDEYFETTKNSSGKYQPTIEGLVYHLGFATRKSLLDCEVRSKEFLNVVRRAKTFIKSCYEKQLYGFAWAGASFALRNIGKEDWSDETTQRQIVENVKADFGGTVHPSSEAESNT
jgi:hypothetical protein